MSKREILYNLKKEITVKGIAKKDEGDKKTAWRTLIVKSQQQDPPSIVKNEMYCSQSQHEMSTYDYESYNLSLSGKKERPDENPEEVRQFLLGNKCYQRDEDDLMEYDPQSYAFYNSYFQVPPKIQKTLTSEELALK